MIEISPWRGPRGFRMDIKERSCTFEFIRKRIFFVEACLSGRRLRWTCYTSYTWSLLRYLVYESIKIRYIREMILGR